MAQDRINYLCQRLEEGASVARVVRAARALSQIPWPTMEHREAFEELKDAVSDLYTSAYIELPDH